MSDGPGRFMIELCNRETYIRIILVLASLFLLVQVPYLIVTDPGSALFTISVINVVGLLVFASCSGWVVWRCRAIE